MKKVLLLISLCVLCACSRSTERISVIFPGDYADPTIVNVDGDYYMTHSSFGYYPGLLVWHSRDLKNWTPVTRALTTIVGNVWAPEIVHHNGKFYIYFPTDIGGNYVITADDPAGPWSEPIKLDVGGIDPGHIADSAGSRYLYVNGGRVAHLSDDGLSAESAAEKVYDGWQYPADWAVECFCLESPKLTARDGYYYMVSAEGGTSGPSTSHMAVVARSRSVLGPWENDPSSPLVHTFAPSEPWVSKGHATLFEGARDKWYVVYHAYEYKNRPLGRSTLLEPVEWTGDGWVKVDTHGAPAEDYVTYKSNRTVSDDFSADKLNWQWFFDGLGSMNDFNLGDGALTLTGDSLRTRALLSNVMEPDFEITVELDVDGDVETGLVLYGSDRYYTGIGFSNGKVHGLQRGRSAWGDAEAPDCRFLKLKADHYTVSVSYSNDGKQWTPYHAGFDVSSFSSEGFASLKLGVLCKGGGSVTVRDFTYEPLY